MISQSIPDGTYYILTEGSIVNFEGATVSTGCSSELFSSSVVMDGITQANAGTNKTVCSSSTSLSGNAVGTGETGQWTRLSGSGTIASSGNSTTNITGLGVGNNIFTWTITQDLTCTSSSNVTINRLNITAASAGINQVVCSSAATLNGNAPAGGENGVWTLINGSGSFSNSTQSNTTVSGLSEGTNTFRWTIQDNGGNCSNTDDVAITYTNLTTPDAGSDDEACPDEFVALNGNTAQTGETGTWSVVSGSGSFTNVNSNTSQVSGLTVGANTLRWTISDNGSNCSNKIDEVIITVSNLAVSEISASRVEPSCFGNADGSITVIGSGGTGLPSLDYEFTLSNGDQVFANAGQEVAFTGLAAGTYTFTIRDNSCTVPYSQTIILTNPPAIIATETLSNFNGYQLSCNGATDGAIALNVTGGAGSYTYSWDSGQTTKDISGLTAGNYTVTITDANNCPEQIIYTLNEPFILSESIITSDYSGTNISCNGAADGFIDLDITGGAAPYTYSWSTGASTQDLASLVAGTYSVTVTDANNCINIINNIILNEPDVLSLSIGSNINVQCNGTATGEVTLSSLGGGTGKQYSLDGINYQAGNTFSGLVAGSYTFDVIDANGCSNQINTTLTEPTLLIATIGSVQNTTCGDLNGSATITAVGGVASYTYTWRNAANTIIGNSPVLSGVGGGIYEVTVIDANGCSIMQSANISSTDGPQTTAAAITPTTCFNSTDGSATLNITGAAPFDVAWANGETELTATSLQSGNNTVVITDNNGCVAVEVVNIPSPSTISISNIINTQPTCFNSTDGFILVDATGGSGGYTYAWSNGTTGNQLSGVTQGTYTLTITDSNGCQLLQEVELVGVEPIIATLVSQTTPTCEGDTDGQLEIQALGGNGSYTYAWAGGQTGASLTSIEAGLYEVTITDAKGCFVVQHIELEDADLFVIDPFEDVIEICTGSSYIADYNLTGASYSWSSNNGFASTSNEVTLTQPGNYQLTVTNQNGCVAQDGFELVISNDLLNADFLLISEAYVGDTVFVIDISWPVPEALTWGFANNVTVLEQGLDYAALVFNEPDIYAVNMTVQLADCSGFYTQTINILDRSEKENINGRVGETQELITQFDVYPNPNFGDFSIDIELAQEANIQVQLIDLQRNIVVLNNNYSDDSSYNIQVQKYDLKPGLYLVTLKAKAV
ncbi:MAG: T9SS type A sorting domain-containing protein [Cyclobacteriaceae bacterium]|nr:T9SS type A sorting domain-containing protein [Cyclobacteriaceae bacterium]